MLPVQSVFKSVTLIYIFFTRSLKKEELLSSVFQRPASEQKELLNKWNEMGTDEPGKIN